MMLMIDCDLVDNVDDHGEQETPSIAFYPTCT